MDIQNPIVGPRSISDGSEPQLRAGRTAELIVQPAHGELYEETARGNIWTISTAAAGINATTVVAAGVSAARCIVGLYNPTSDTNLFVTRTVIVQVSGSAVTGGYVWGSVASPTAITSTGQLGVNNRTMTSGGHRAYAFNGSTIVTGITTTVLFRYIGGFIAGTIAAGQNATLEEVEDDLVVGPGCFLGVFVAVAGTNTTATGSLSWAEIPA